jgi:hypothetical protein
MLIFQLFAPVSTSQYIKFCQIALRGHKNILKNNFWEFEGYVGQNWAKIGGQIQVKTQKCAFSHYLAPVSTSQYTKFCQISFRGHKNKVKNNF